jgi:LmbE family N-acetylglucosaminyl deacetylase
MTAAFAIANPRGIFVQWAGWLSAHAPVSLGRRRRAGPAAAADGSLPSARTVLAITARPGKESTDLGGLLHAFRTAGARVALLCLTRGEASALNSTSERLEVLRPRELQLAAGLLGVSSVAVADYPDGELHRCPILTLAERVQRAITEHAPDLLLVVDPAVGDSDDAQVARAACLTAGSAGVSVAARTWPGARSGFRVALGPEAAAARAVQRSAAAAHASQAEALPEIRRRLDRLGDEEQMRWLLAPESRTDTQVLIPRRRVPVAS